MKRICALTMVRDDVFFLRKWIEYYGSQLGRENLYIYFDGKDQSIPDFCSGTNAMLCDRVAGMVAKADKGRINFLSAQARILFREYDIVIGTDVDEFLVVDPALNLSLAGFLDTAVTGTTVSGLGLDMGQDLNLEDEIDPARPFLSQRRFAYLSSRYTKTNVIASPVDWGSGFHRVKRHNFHIVKDLYLFHIGCIDLNNIRKRMKDTDRMANGWSRHLEKRTRTIRIVTEGKKRRWDSLVPMMRTVQTVFRPVFALNKPSDLGMKLVVEIPERFRNIF